MASKGKKKKSKKQASEVQVKPTNWLVMHGAALVAVSAATFYLGEEWRWLAPDIVIIAIIAGLLTGFSGNPLMPLVIPPAVGVMSSRGLQINFPEIVVAGRTPLIFTAIICIVAGLSTFYSSKKNGTFKYEPALLVPCLGLTGLGMAFWARHTAPLFNDIMVPLFDSGVFLGLIVASVAVLMGHEWKNGVGAAPRSFLLCIIAGPIVGFWVGYAEVYWIYLLVTLLMFLMSPILRHGPATIVAGMPLMAAPFWAARAFNPSAGDAVEIIRSAAEGLAEPRNAAVLLCFAVAHLFAFKVLETFRGGSGRHIFYGLNILFMAVILVLLFIGNIK